MPSTPLAREGESSRPQRANGLARAATLLVLLCVMAVTAIRIEILNARAGGFLPAREYSADTQTPVKWHQSLCTSESRWRETLGPKDEQGHPVNRDLTADERAAMERDLRHAVANNALRDVVSIWGLAQYPFVIAGFVLGLTLLFGGGVQRWMRVLGGSGIVLASAAGLLMLHRAYFSSLGW